jgi:flagellar hook-associated protein 2
VTSSVDGLVSGLQTTSLINQLMTVEAAPQDRLKTKLTTAQTAVASYQSVNTKLAAFKSAASDLSQLGTWRSIKATSSSSSVTATTSAGDLTSSSGSLTFDVKRLASKQVTTLKVSTTTSSVDTDNDGIMETVGDPITGNTSINITPGTYAEDGTFTPGTPVPIDISADRSATGIAKAINSAGLGVKAYVVKTSDNTGVLQVTGINSGAANGFVISGLEGAGIDGTDPATTIPKDARIQVGDPDTTGYSVTSSTNTFTGLMAGVTLTVSKEEDAVTVDASADVSGIAAKFQAMVDAANATLGEISNQTAYDQSTKQGSPLTGDFMVRNMSQTILSSVSLGLTYANPAYTGPGDLLHSPTLDGGSFSKYGIQLSRDGQLTFDAAKFTAAYNADPAGIQQAGIGMADNFEAMADTQSTSVTAVITGRNSEIDTMTDQISDWDTRLAAKREALQKQYADLETALGKLKDQSSWLSGQLAGLS